MVKSIETESEILRRYGYSDRSEAAVLIRPAAPRLVLAAPPVARNSAERSRRVYRDEQRHIHAKPAKLRRSRSANSDLLIVAKMTVGFAVACAMLLVCVTAHMQVAANDREIQQLDANIVAAQAEHEALTNALATRSNQFSIATMARRYKMVQSPGAMTVALTYDQGEPSFGPQIASAQ